MIQLGLFGEDRAVDIPDRPKGQPKQIRMFSDRDLIQFGVTACPKAENQSYSIQGGLWGLPRNHAKEEHFRQERLIDES